MDTTDFHRNDCEGKQALEEPIANLGEDGTAGRLTSHPSTSSSIASATASELKLHLQDLRDTFLYEYGELEQEVLDLRSLVGDLHHQVDTANRRWAQERDLKVQLEQQLMWANQVDPDLCSSRAIADELCVPIDDEDQGGPEQPCSLGVDAPGTPSGEEHTEENRRQSGPSATGSSVDIELPNGDMCTKPLEDPDVNLELALEAQIALAKLREEHRNLIEELVAAKMQIADLRSAQEVEEINMDRAHLTTSIDSVSKSKQKPGLSWFRIS